MTEALEGICTMLGRLKARMEREAAQMSQACYLTDLSEEEGEELACGADTLMDAVRSVEDVLESLNGRINADNNRAIAREYERSI